MLFVSSFPFDIRINNIISLKGFKSFPKNLHLKYIVYTGDEELLIDDIRVLPFEIFVKRLHLGKIILT